MRHALFSLILLLFTACPSLALVVEFRDKASVDESIITLGDIAHLEGESALVAALASRQVGQAPPPGETMSIDSSHIADSLTPALAGHEKIIFKGADTIRVSRNAQQISSEQILEIIESYLAKNKDKLPDAQIRFLPAEQPLPFSVQTGDLDWEVIPANPAILGSGRFSLIVKIDGKVRKNMSVKGRIEALAKVAVATVQIEKDAPLRADQFSLTVKDISELDKPCLNLAELTGRRASRTIKSGSVLTSSMLELLPLVHRGDSVKILVRQNGLELTAVGTAQADGAKEQTIRVENTSSKKIISGRVAAPGLVEVTL